MMRHTNVANKRADYSPIGHRRAIERIAQVSKFIDSASDEPAGAQQDFGPQQQQQRRHKQRPWHDAHASTDDSLAHQHRAHQSGLPAQARYAHSAPLAYDERQTSPSPTPSPSPSPPLDSRQQHHQQAAQGSPGGSEQQEVEEVYLCSCCGVTKQLEPAMSHVPAFRMVFHLFNTLAFVFAFGLLGMGLWFRIDPKVYELHKYIETQNFTIAGWIMLFGGFVACLLSPMGCRAASKGSVRWLLFYCFIMTVLVVAFIGTLVLLTVHGLGLTLERFFGKEIYDQIRRRAMNTELIGEDDATQFMDFVQVKLRCCGSMDFRDYQKLGMVIPATCYTIPSNYIMAPGCAEAIRRMFDLRAGLAAGFTAASVVTQLLALIMAALVACSIYNHRTSPGATTR